MKTCFKCNTQKPLTDFYKHPGMADGHLNKCKSCAKVESTAHRNANIEKVRAYDLERSKHPHRAKLHYEQTQMWRAADKRRNKCHNAVARAIKSGELTRQPCIRCGDVKSLAHHENYDEPLNVMWLCNVCHRKRHNEIRKQL